MKGKQSTKVELGLLEQLDLADVDVLKREDALAALLDLVANDLGDELGDELVEGDTLGLAGHDLGHLAADLTDLGGLSVGSTLDLVGRALGEGNGKQADEVVVAGLDGDLALDQSLPLADERAKLVAGEVETVEVGQDVTTLDLVNTETNAAGSVVLRALEVSEGDVQNTALELVVGVTQTTGTVDHSLADVADIKRSGGLDGVPVFAGEGVDGLLLGALLAHTLVLSDNHFSELVLAALPRML